MRALIRMLAAPNLTYGTKGSTTPCVLGEVVGAKSPEGYPINVLFVTREPFKRGHIKLMTMVGFYKVLDHSIYDYYLVGADTTSQNLTVDFVQKSYRRIRDFVSLNFIVAVQGDGHALPKLLESFIIEDEEVK